MTVKTHHGTVVCFDCHLLSLKKHIGMSCIKINTRSLSIVDNLIEIRKLCFGHTADTRLSGVKAGRVYLDNSEIHTIQHKDRPVDTVQKTVVYSENYMKLRIALCWQLLKSHWIGDSPTGLTFNFCTLCPHCIYVFCICL